MDKETMIHMYSAILLSHKKEHIWVGSNEVDEPRAYYTEWCKSEIEILYTDAYIWNLKRWYWWINFEGSSGKTDIENRPIDTGGREGGEGEVYGESNMKIYNTICKIDSQQEFAVWLREHKWGSVAV